MNKNELIAELEKSNKAIAWASDIQKKSEEKNLSEFACLVSTMMEKQADLIRQLKELS
jgi:hypothetical protein